VEGFKKGQWRNRVCS
jgi:hypothetical protein